MHQSIPGFPSVPVTFSGQSLISHAGVKVLTGFMDALGFGGLCKDRLGQFVPAGAKHRPGRLIGSLAAMLAAGGEHVSDLHPGHSHGFGRIPLVIKPAGGKVEKESTRRALSASVRGK